MKKMNRAIALLSALFALLPVGVRATQTENHGIHAVPAPPRVTIDGRLNEWDLSGQTLICYDIETLKDTYSATVAMMYDTENLYISFHWKSPRPMSSVHDPHYQAAKARAGDAVQLRFKTDVISHVTAWYYAARKEPAIHIERGKTPEETFGGGEQVLFRTKGWQLASGAEMAFVQDLDKKGYIQEMKLPWNLVTRSKKYKAGDMFACGVDLQRGSADWPVHHYSDNLQIGKTDREFFWTAKDAWGPVSPESKGHLKLPVPAYMIRALRPEKEAQGPVQIEYNLAVPGRVTIAIDDSKGESVRDHIPALPRESGKRIEKWDGLDDDGKPAPPGTYHLKIISHSGLHSNWALSFNNPGNPVWNTPNGRGAWYADHTPPQAAAAGGAYVALACPMGEGGPPVIACDLTEQKLWEQANRTAFDGGRISLATDGKILCVASEGKKSVIYRVNIADGTHSPWDKEAADEHGAAYKILDLTVSDLPGMGSDTHPPANLTSIALRDNTLAVCLTRENSILLLNATTGEVKRRISVSQPRSAAIAAAGSLIALVTGGLRRITLTAGNRAGSG